MTQMIVVLWLTCGLVGAGISNASNQRGFPSCAAKDKWQDWIVPIMFSITGPLWLLSTLMVDGIEHGWSLVPGCGVERNDRR